MIKFILNDQIIETDLPGGLTVLDFVRYRRNLKGTKIGCREGDCGACTILVGEFDGEQVKYRSQTSCLMPLANSAGKHIVTVEGINPPDERLTPVQQAMVENNGTQCGFCTVGFVMSLTGFCLDETPKTCEAAVSAIDGNICRCTGYKSIERAAAQICSSWSEIGARQESLDAAIKSGVVPRYFAGIKDRLIDLNRQTPRSDSPDPKFFVGGGTDLYVQRPEEMIDAPAENLFDRGELRTIEEKGDSIEVGASVTVTDLLVSPVFQQIFANLYRHLKLVSSTPIRNMATLAGNFVNASPIGDMTVWFLALDAEVTLAESFLPSTSAGAPVRQRTIRLKDFYLGYKKLAKAENEYITKIRFHKNIGHFNFEKVSKRTYLDIASVNTAISLRLAEAAAGEPAAIAEASVSAGGVAPIPLYLGKTSEFLRGRLVDAATVAQAKEILQTEISPISDVRGSAEYKRLLLGQLFTAHFVELFPAAFDSAAKRA